MLLPPEQRASFGSAIASGGRSCRPNSDQSAEFPETAGLTETTLMPCCSIPYLALCQPARQL